MCKLLSFPTRRSSDLRSPAHALARRRAGRARRLRTSGARALSRAAAARREAARQGADRKIRLLRGDRKSTRLNSSHMSISYAVFCLKKKTLEKNNKQT